MDTTATSNFFQYGATTDPLESQILSAAASAMRTLRSVSVFETGQTLGRTMNKTEICAAISCMLQSVDVLADE